jgi:Fe-S-cluster-containing dehydrogenase component/CRP-like cAMP-binding protein
LHPGLPSSVLGRAVIHQKNIFQAIAQLWSNPQTPEARDPSLYSGKQAPGRSRMESDLLQASLTNVDAILKGQQTATLKPGAMFGEIAALTRATRTTTIIAMGPSEVLQMRRQGIRDICRYVADFRNRVQQLYRENVLMLSLRRTPLFKHLDDDTVGKIAERTLFETYGDFDWHISFNRFAAGSSRERFAQEPLIAEEENYPDGLLLIQSGFARLSHRVNHGHKTVRFMGTGDVFGLEEIAHNWREKDSEPCALQHTLRAVGYTDVLRVPTHVIEELVLPTLPPAMMPEAIDRQRRSSPALFERRQRTVQSMDETKQLATGVLESLVENRYINGTKTMLIDLDRCVRCDACVDACAKGHNNNPRFVRHGQKVSHYMVANACMHCTDPVCMIGCPTGAIHRSARSGEVVINDATCIGCSTCASNCPYDNIRMVEIRDGKGGFIRDELTNVPIVKATKCDFCVDQLGGPACQRACPHDALKRMDMADMDSLVNWMSR